MEQPSTSTGITSNLPWYYAPSRTRSQSSSSESEHSNNTHNNEPEHRDTAGNDDNCVSDLDDDDVELNEIHVNDIAHVDDFNVPIQIQLPILEERFQYVGYVRTPCSDELVAEHTIGRLREQNMCQHCGAFYFDEEKAAHNRNVTVLCCQRGTVHLPRVECTPNIKSLYYEDGNNERNFRKFIRAYNTAHAFASTRGKFDQTVQVQGPYCVRVNGQITHTIHPALNEDNARPKFGQLYILDSAEASVERYQQYHLCIRPVNDLIEHDIALYNVYARSYKMLGDVLKEHHPSGDATDHILLCFMRPDIKLRNLNEPAWMIQQYDEPQSEEVAAVFIGEVPPIDQMDVVVYPKKIVIYHFRE